MALKPFEIQCLGGKLDNVLFPGTRPHTSTTSQLEALATTRPYLSQRGALTEVRHSCLTQGPRQLHAGPLETFTCRISGRQKLIDAMCYSQTQLQIDGQPELLEVHIAEMYDDATGHTIWGKGSTG